MSEAGYTHEQIINQCTAALDHVATFYQKPFINYRGITNDTGELYSEVISEFICDHIEVFKKKIPVISRRKYKVSNHDGNFSDTSNRKEEILAMKLFNQCKSGVEYDYIGTIIDYQVPLKAKQGDTAGKIDLLSYDGSVLRVLELKKEDSKETMLRCVMEGYTYMRTVDKDSLLKSYNLPSDCIVKASPFVFFGMSQYQEMQEERPKLKKLMKCLCSEPFYIRKENGLFFVEK